MAQFEQPGPAWRKSSASGSSNCVEARLIDKVHVRDSKEPGPRLAFGAEPWALFLGRSPRSGR